MAESSAEMSGFRRISRRDRRGHPQIQLMECQWLYRVTRPIAANRKLTDTAHGKK